MSKHCPRDSGRQTKRNRDLSSVAILKSAREKLTDPRNKSVTNRFALVELLVYPNLGEPISESATQTTGLSLTAWPAKGSTGTLAADSWRFRQNNRSVGKTSGQLPAADEQGQIKRAQCLSADKFQPGIYELKMTVGDDKNSVSRSTRFTVAP